MKDMKDQVKQLKLSVPTAETGRVAYWVHIGGFLAGLGFGFVYKQFYYPHLEKEHGNV